MKGLQKQIALLSVQFHTNIAQDTPTLHLKKGELLGINDDFINSLKRDNEGYVLPCDYRDIHHIYLLNLLYSPNSELTHNSALCAIALKFRS